MGKGKKRLKQKEKPLPKNQRITLKQLTYLKSLMSPEELAFLDKHHTSKQEASFLIKSLNGTF